MLKTYHEKYRNLLKPYQTRKEKDSYKAKLLAFKQEAMKLSLTFAPANELRPVALIYTICFDKCASCYFFVSNILLWQAEHLRIRKL